MKASNGAMPSAVHPAGNAGPPAQAHHCPGTRFGLRHRCRAGRLLRCIHQRVRSLFCFSDVKLGIIPALAAPYIMRAIGPRAARRYFVTAERINAGKARAWA
jgi:hypothetical protein